MPPVNKVLYWFAWLVFFIAAFTVFRGGYLEVTYGSHLGLYFAFAGFIGLSLSGLMMTIAFGVPSS